MKTLQMIMKAMNIPRVEDDELQKKSYEDNKKFYRKTTAYALTNTELTLEQYYAGLIRLKLNERTLKQFVISLIECDDSGHIEDEMTTNLTPSGAFYNCKRCSMRYHRELSTKERTLIDAETGFTNHYCSN
jgi:hypothetical protein